MDLFQAIYPWSVSVNHVCVVPSECPAGMFGLGCRHRCQCDNKALCDHVSGACTCQVGWTGTFCEKRERISLIRNPNTQSCSLVTSSVFVFQHVLRVSTGWIARRSVYVSTVGPAITSAAFVFVLLAGWARSAT